MRPILAALVTLAALTLAGAAQARSDRDGGVVVRQIVVELDGRPRRVAARLAAALPDEAAPMAMGDGSYMLGATGRRLPAALLRFLAQSLEGADPGLPLDRLRTVSLHLEPSEAGTRLRMVLVAARTGGSRRAAVQAFHERVTGAALGPGDEILFDGATTGGTGDLVLSRPGSRRAAADAYAQSLRETGRRVSVQSFAGDTLVVGEAEGAAALVFVQPDADRPARSLVVIRSVEGD